MVQALRAALPPLPSLGSMQVDRVAVVASHLALPFSFVNLLLLARPALAADKRALTAALLGSGPGVVAGAAAAAGGADEVTISPENAQQELMFLMIHALRASPCQVNFPAYRASGTQHALRITLHKLLQSADPVPPRVTGGCKETRGGGKQAWHLWKRG